MDVIYLFLIWNFIKLPAAIGNEVITSYISSNYDWDSRSYSVTTTCTPIPRNLSLCYDIGYDRMRLPNLLEHDTLLEIYQQAASFVPLLNINCHPDTKRFLSSLFCPVCLDHPIYPCRSLCEKVKTGCEGTMKVYGFPWPDIFACTLFPIDNDMCITADMVNNATLPVEKCKICDQANTVENILYHFCQSSFAVHGKLRNIHENVYTFRKIKLLKAINETRKEFRFDTFQLRLNEGCCKERIKGNHSSYFIMGTTFNSKSLHATFVMPWIVKHSKSFKKSIRTIRTFNCSNPEDITHTVINLNKSSEQNIKVGSKNKTETVKRRRKKPRKHSSRKYD